MIVQDGQNIYDIVLQEFGDLEMIFTGILIPNKLDFDTILKPGRQIFMNSTGKGNENVKNYIKTNNLTINNGSIVLSTAVTEDLAIQWPIFVDVEEIINISKRIRVEL